MSTLAQLLADAGLPRLEAQLLLHMAGGGNRVTQLTWPEREAMLRAALSSADNARLQVLPVRDYYNEAVWVQAVRRSGGTST